MINGSISKSKSTDTGPFHSVTGTESMNYNFRESPDDFRRFRWRVDFFGEEALFAPDCTSWQTSTFSVVTISPVEIALLERKDFDTVVGTGTVTVVVAAVVVTVACVAVDGDVVRGCCSCSSCSCC